MQNLPSTDDAFVQRLREVHVPNAPPTLAAQLQRQRHHGSATRWALPAGAVGLATMALVVGLSMRPSLTLAQVARSVQSHTQFTIVNTRILNKPGGTIKQATYRDGNLWRIGGTYGYPDRTLHVFHQPPRANFVLIDEATPAPPATTRIDELLRRGVKPRIERGVTWQGRKVDRFTLHDTYRNGHDETWDQEVIADPETGLPIRMTIMRDNKSWGDVWDFDFAKPDPKVFTYTVADDARKFELRQQREALLKDLSQHRSALVTDELGGAILLVPASTKADFVRSSTVEIGGDSLKGHVIDFVLERPKAGPVAMRGILIGKERFNLVQLGNLLPDGPRPSWFEKASVSLTMSTSDGKVRLQDVPITHTGMAILLLKRFGIGR